MNEDSRIRSGLMIVVASFAIGVAIYLAIAWFLWNRDPPRQPSPGTPLLTNLSIAIFVVSLVVRMVARRAMRSMKQGRQQFTVAGAAILEFGGLFACTAYLIEGTPASFGVALITIPLILALQLPTEARWAEWSGGAPASGSDVPDQFEL